MESLIKSDVFFFVTTICVVLITILFAVILIYLIRVFKDIDFLSKKIKQEGEEIINDAHNIRMDLKTGAKKASDILSIFSFLNKKKRKNKD
ncbi:MAG: hypothetical protein WCO18_01135 [bacterium]